MSASTTWMDWVGFACGAAVVIGTSASIIGALVVPRRVDSIVTGVVDKVLDKLFLLILKPVRAYDVRDQVLGWQAPIALVARLTVWMTMLVFGYVLLMLPMANGNWGQAVNDAGSSVFTLGFSVPQSAGGHLITYIAGFTGMVVVGLQVGYLPTIYSEFNRRETEVSLLVARSGLPAWGAEILVRTHWGTDGGEIAPVLSDLFIRWERWTAEVAESHTTYPALLRLRSPRVNAHWLTSLVAVMDAAALHLALAPTTEPKIEARLVLRMGFETLNQIAQVLKLTVPERILAGQPVPPDVAISVTYEDFAEAAQQLRDVGYPVEISTEDAWPHFRGWRINYDVAALALCRNLDAPPSMWTGSRRWHSEPLRPFRPAPGLRRT
ncbi:MFS transporter [Nocardioides baekrokdamisoli]|nr:hypothetical protein [Nocardioides baekrokdamisoli]